jgi:hypothetical protein
MGHTICWAAERALAEEQVRAALRYIALEHDRTVFRIASYTPGVSVELTPVRSAPAEPLAFAVDNGLVVPGHCKTNHSDAEDTEVKRLLAAVAALLGGRLHVWCDGATASVRTEPAAQV